jgi:hypothetical protein
MRHTKLLNRPARLLLIAMVATASAAIPLRAATPAIAQSSLNQHHAIANGKTRLRQEWEQIIGIERWGINE